MRKQLAKIALTATLGLALALTFSCSSDDDGVGGNSGSLAGNSSPSGGVSSSSVVRCDASLFAGGNGTEANPWQISTPEQLQNLKECQESNPNYYVLNNDIDLTEYLSGTGNNNGAGWEPIHFNYGNLNGKGYKVSGLWINRPKESFVGLFSTVGFGNIILGTAINNIGVEIDNTKGGVKGKEYVGGLAGSNYVAINNSYATGNVTGDRNANGSYAYGAVGGLVGDNTGPITNSYATGNVTGGDRVGGLVGGGIKYVNNNIINNSYATGNVTGVAYVGGLVGDGEITITNSYATGNVTGVAYVGGLVGNAGSDITSSYAAGNVNVTGTRTSDVGGLVGRVYDPYGENTIISSSYYDKQTTGQTDTGKGEGKSTAEMKTRSTYVGWDFATIWEIKNNDYPTLQMKR